MDHEEKHMEEVHGFNIHVEDEGSHTIKDLMHNWKHDMSHEELDKVLHNVRHAPEGKLHLDEKTTMIHHSDGTYTLKRRDH